LVGEAPLGGHHRDERQQVLGDRLLAGDELRTQVGGAAPLLIAQSPPVLGIGGEVDGRRIPGQRVAAGEQLQGQRLPVQSARGQAVETGACLGGVGGLGGGHRAPRSAVRRPTAGSVTAVTDDGTRQGADSAPIRSSTPRCVGPGPGAVPGGVTVSARSSSALAAAILSRASSPAAPVCSTASSWPATTASPSRTPSTTP